MQAQIRVAGARPGERTLAGNGSPDGVRVSAQMRESDPTIMDVRYIVNTDPGTTPTVNVRVLAFENGNRGFATVVRPETFIEGTGANVGDGIAANEEHALSWKVPADWETDLAKVTFEVLAMVPGDGLLPLHLITIPATNGHPKTSVSIDQLAVNRCRYQGYCEEDDDEFQLRALYDSHWPLYADWSDEQYYLDTIEIPELFNALLWLYSDRTGDLVLINGELRQGSRILIRHNVFLLYSSYAGVPETSSCEAFRYVFDKMGFGMDGAELDWVNQEARLDLIPVEVHTTDDWFRGDLPCHYAVRTE